MFHKLRSYLKFLLKSTNQHGVHSPFVFAFVTKCLYTKRRLHRKKSIDVLLKSIGYFHFNMVQTPNDSLFKQIIEDVYPKTTFNSEKFDLLYAIELNQTGFDQLLSKHVLHNDSMILIEGIHSNPEKERQWESLIQNSNITVSIDMFYCGALFIRKEQVKEHFIIRI